MKENKKYFGGGGVGGLTTTLVTNGIGDEVTYIYKYGVHMYVCTYGVIVLCYKAKYLDL